MSLKLVANNKQTNIDNFTIELPETSLKLDTIHLEYDSLKAFDRFTEQVHFSFRTLPSQVTLKDISPFVPILSHFKEPVTLDMEVKGTVDQLTCSHLEITADDRQFRLRGMCRFRTCRVHKMRMYMEHFPSFRPILVESAF